ncbi:hypothetical protein [Nonomuraea recticatena]|uniref:Resolvase/invertase-type recombinase catalytic domain-containing protein n=1 Tax=Nonomuraea recticatena TaxID=46178 RepID=A0ABN3T7Y9_9ACTN
MLTEIGEADEALLAGRYTTDELANLYELASRGPSKPRRTPPRAGAGRASGACRRRESEAEQVELVERLTEEGHSVRALERGPPVRAAGSD